MLGTALSPALMRTAVLSPLSVATRVLLTRQIPKRSFFRIVDQGFQGLRVTFGANPELLQPGIRLSIPLIHHIFKVEMREQSIVIGTNKQPMLHAFTKDNVPVLIGGSLFFQIYDAQKATFNVNEVRDQVMNVGTSAIRSVVGLYEYDDIIADRNTINMRLCEVIGKTIENWGTRCTRFEIQHFAPANKEIEKQLEMQMAAERERRKQILDTEAQVNVSEGLKRKQILESEGLAASIKNRSEAEKYRLEMESQGKALALKNQADAERYEQNQRSQALKDQVEKVAEAFGGDFELASSFLLKTGALSQFSHVGRGSTFVVPSDVFELFKSLMPKTHTK
eukprot:TRINITY_DN4643_c0_g1_i1.p1 TRINITY_DN4643_c0_g1~~TRINITY_DN4643_c0_g1_i1.p1  ORF type:complete len:337 (-),score=77.44 TRINITY_DN4643_c0_g1_i1:73-1083(-)